MYSQFTSHIWFLLILDLSNHKIYHRSFIFRTKTNLSAMYMYMGYYVIVTNKFNLLAIFVPPAYAGR